MGGPSPLRSPEGARQLEMKLVPPLQGSCFFESNTQGCARASLALGWLVLHLWCSRIPTHGECAGHALRDFYAIALPSKAQF